VWHEPGDALGIRLRLANQGPAALDGFRLQVRVYEPARSRSDLHLTFEADPPGVERSSFPVDLPDLSVATGTSTVVEIDEPVETLASLTTTGISGVYPLTVTVTDAAGFASLDTLTTQLLYFPTKVEVPLNLVPVWPLADYPSRGERGLFEADPSTGTTRLEGAVGDGGWLAGVTDALLSDVGRKLRYGLAPMGRLVDELADMADGYRRVEDGNLRTIAPGDQGASAAVGVLDDLRSLMEADNAQVVLAAYALPDLPFLGELEATTAQISAAESVLEDDLGGSPGRAWILPAGGRLDEPTLDRLRASDAAASTFVSADSLEPPAEDATAVCAEVISGGTYNCPVRLVTTSGGARAYPLDNELQQRFGALVAAPADRGALQRLLAETAMIHFELPGTADRVVPLVVPPLWHPPPGVAARFVRALATGPWLRSRTPTGGLHLGIGAADRELVAAAPEVRTQPDDDYIEEVAAAAGAVESFSQMHPPDGLVQRLGRDVLVAQSRLWWSDAARLAEGSAFAVAARAEVDRELGKISVFGQENITLTSRRGEIPLNLVNRTNYDVTAEISIESFDRDITLDEHTIEDTFPPGATFLPVQATARASGVFLIQIRVLTPDGLTIDETTVSIRSTEYNEIALGITVGALAFLVMFYMFRGLGRRRAAAVRAGD
jgi:hypothetical protein